MPPIDVCTGVSCFKCSRCWTKNTIPQIHGQVLRSDIGAKVISPILTVRASVPFEQEACEDVVGKRHPNLGGSAGR